MSVFDLPEHPHDGSDNNVAANSLALFDVKDIFAQMPPRVQRPVAKPASTPPKADTTIRA